MTCLANQGYYVDIELKKPMSPQVAADTLEVLTTLNTKLARCSVCVYPRKVTEASPVFWVALAKDDPGNVLTLCKTLDEVIDFLSSHHYL